MTNFKGELKIYILFTLHHMQVIFFSFTVKRKNVVSNALMYF